MRVSLWRVERLRKDENIVEGIADPELLRPVVGDREWAADASAEVPGSNLGGGCTALPVMSGNNRDGFEESLSEGLITIDNRMRSCLIFAHPFCKEPPAGFLVHRHHRAGWEFDLV